jgi:coproporphyrinogen III oxidase-like Fe-S oxidoreductase
MDTMFECYKDVSAAADTLLLLLCLQISNYAKPGHRSRHNQVYWKCQPYYAFGLGAASYTRGRRFSRPRGMQEYEKWVQRFVQSGGGCPAAELPVESKVGKGSSGLLLRKV